MHFSEFSVVAFDTTRDPDRRNTMKSGTKDQAEGTFHKVRGKLKEIAGKLGMNSE